MKISPVSKMPSFLGATVNVVAFSDTHGHIEAADCALQTVLNNDCFEKTKDSNYLICGGDWFISGDKKGFLSDENKTLCDFQLDMFNEFIKNLKEYYPKLRAFFVPGNHEFDGEDKLFKEIVDKIDAKVLMSNLDFEKSPVLTSEIVDGKVITSSETFVQDDKDETKYHPVLNLSVLPFNLDYYSGSLEGISMLDNAFMPDKKIKPKDYKKSFDAIIKKADEYKEKYPNGIVILTCHAGCNFALRCAETEKFDVIFDAHIHKDKIKYIASTPVVPLSQNFKKIVNVKLRLDDDGLLERRSIRSFKPLEDSESPDFKKGKLGIFYDNLFLKDTEKIYRINPKDPSIKKLDTTNIRLGNNNLANFVCDIVLNQIQKHDPTVQIFALNSSAIRGGFDLNKGNNVSQFDVINCLNGIQRKQADIYINELTGADLALMVVDNLIFNSIEPERNSIIHYCGITVDKDKILDGVYEGKGEDEICSHIIFEATNEPIDPNKTYKIANVEKYFIKATTPTISAYFDSAIPLGQNLLDLFVDYFKDNQTTDFTLKERIL